MGGLRGPGLPPSPDEPDDHYDIGKQEADDAMEDLPPEYQVVLAAGYDEDTLLQQVLETSKADEDRAFPDLQEVLALTGMVAEHLASLPSPPPLRAHAPPGGVRGAGGSAWHSTRCRHDNPH
jgi:hypothetical protein